ncbi:MAG: carbon starvation CstA 5TM domain-containing protein, partial [Thermoguttaceae bacterium]
VGMAKVFASLPGMKTLMAYWYHFIIMFEALFILTLLETGTRVARFIFQETIEQIFPAPAARDSSEPRGRWIAGLRGWGLNIAVSCLVCSLWGYLLYTGNIGSLWRMMGIANQLLATVALAVGTTYLLTHARKRSYALCAGLPFVFAAVTVFTAGIQSIESWWAELALPETTASQALSIRLMCLLAAIMLVLSGLVIADAIRRWYVLLRAGAKPAAAL